MDHGRAVEREFDAVAEVERVAFSDFEDLVDPVKSLEHEAGRFVTDNLDVGIPLAHKFDRRGVIGFHVMDDEIVERFAAQCFLDFFLEIVDLRDFDTVQKCGLFAANDVGIVAYTIRKRPLPFKTLRLAVIDTDIGVIFVDLDGM